MKTTVAVDAVVTLHPSEPSCATGTLLDGTKVIFFGGWPEMLVMRHLLENGKRVEAQVESYQLLN